MVHLDTRLPYHICLGKKRNLKSIFRISAPKTKLSQKEHLSSRKSVYSRKLTNRLNMQLLQTHFILLFTPPE